MVQEAKRIMDSRAFDYVMKVLMLMQSIAIGILVPVLMGMSNQINENALSMARVNAFLEHRLPKKFPPDDWCNRIRDNERAIHFMQIKIEKHLAQYPPK